MTAKKTAIAVCMLLLLTVVTASVLLSISGRVLSSRLHLGGEPSMATPFDLAKYGNKLGKGLGVIAIILALGVPVLAFGGMGIAVLMPKRRELHGSARFASVVDMRKAGLLQPDKPDDKYPSLIVGKHGKTFLLLRGQQFTFLAAPTGSGKGVGIVIPNLLHYRDSVAVLDVKGENYGITAGFRASCGQEVYKFAPDSEDFVSDCWNPLAYVRDDPRYRIKDLMGITNILYPPSDDIWNSTAEKLFIGLALYIMDTAKERDNGNLNIATIKKYRLTLPFLADEATFRAYVQEREGLEPLSDDCVVSLLDYAQSVEKMRQSIGITFDAPLAIFADPITSRATRTNSFDLRAVRKRRMSIYVCISPGNIDKYSKLLNLFFQQLLLLNMDKLPEEDPALKYQCLLLLDEFPAMGRVSIIEKASAYMRGYNMRLLLIFQSKGQLESKDLYDKTGTQNLLTNMAMQICYAPRDDEDAKNYSEMIGYMTEKNVSKSRQLTGKSGRSESQSDQRRAVLLPQEVKEIGTDREIISLENMRPALVDKIRWYDEPVFQRRANMPPPVPPDQREPINSIEPDTSEVIRFVGAAPGQPLGNAVDFEIGFAPNRNAHETVLSIINSAEKELFVAAHAFTSRSISLALGNAKARGVDVRLLIDAANAPEMSGNAIDEYFASKGVPVERCVNYTEMNHNFMVADGLHVQLGSFGYMEDSCHAETAVLLRNTPHLAGIYRTEWLRLVNEPKVSPEQIMAVDAGLAVLHELGI
jgi:type IV secretion system protein VirD4